MSPAVILRARRYVAWLYAALLVLASIRAAWDTLAIDFSAWRLLFGLVLLAWSWALFRLVPGALKFTGAICLLAALFLPLGVFNPFAAMDIEARGAEPPVVLHVLAWLLPCEVVLLASAYLLDLRPLSTTQSKGD